MLVLGVLATISATLIFFGLLALSPDMKDVMNFGDWIYEIVALAAAVAACVGFYAGYFAKKAWGRWLMYYSGVATLVLSTIFYLIYMV